MVKRFLRERSGSLPGRSRHLPELMVNAKPSFENVGRAVRADDAEIARNPPREIGDVTNSVADGCRSLVF